MQPDKAAAIIDLIANGKSQREACDEIGVPDSTFSDWCRKDAALAGSYAHAREARGLLLAEQALVIADDKEIPADQKRLMLDTRKWFAAKLNARQFGEKVDVNHGGQPENPVKFSVIERHIVKKPQPDENEPSS